PVTQRARDILMAPEISTGVEELDHGPAGIRIRGEQYADLAELVCRAVPAAQPRSVGAHQPAVVGGTGEPLVVLIDPRVIRARQNQHSLRSRDGGGGDPDR